MARFQSSSTLVLLSIVIILLHTKIAYSQQLVLATNGEFVQPGVEYYIVPTSNSSLEIGLLSPPNHNCPEDVVVDTYQALPVKFSPLNSKDNFLTVGTDTNIVFSASSSCGTSSVWRIQPSKKLGTSTTRNYFVEIGGVIGNPGKATLSSWFNIESSILGGYVINYCPTVCDTCKPVCGNIGVIRDNNRTRLGIASPPFLLSFVKNGPPSSNT